MKRLEKHTMVWGIFVAVMGILIWFAWPHLSATLPSDRSPANDTPPLPLVLTGPAVFTLLALIIAFAVYLRQVSNRAMDTILRIHANEEKLYPPRKGLEHTDMKLKALLRTHDNLDVAALFMIALIVLIVLRILYDVLARFPSLPDWGIELLLPLVDLVIMVWLFLLFFVLGFVHVFARRHESSVRKKTDEYLATRSDEPETLNRVSNTASTKPALGQRRMHPFVVWGAVLLLASLFDQGRKRAP